MNGAQITMIVLISINLLGAAYDQGKGKKDKSLWSTFVSVGLNVSILWWGGFWK